MGKKNIRESGSHSPYLWMSVTVLALFGVYFVLNGNGATRGPGLASTLPTQNSPSTAPAFRLTDIQGRPVALSDFRGKVVILDFWATWCPPCRREIPDFISLQSRYKDKGLQIVGVALDEPEKVGAFAKSWGMNYPVLLGNDEVSALYGGISGIPTTFIIDRKGNIVEKFEGFTDKSVFESEIQRLLSSSS
ncbi:MAG TPA: TlpA disulfide reductase family protein [Bacteroidota bacterium]|nr:TlpA disulfide reductase family protein [Bacteroidota bacterium]